MHYSFEIKPKLEQKPRKIRKKDSALFNAAKDKIDQIIINPLRYKSLRYDLKGLRRVHLRKSFVLVFEIDEEQKIVRFIDLRLTMRS